MESSTKKALKEQYKKRPVVGGVYCVKCGGSGDVWIRSTTDMQGSQNRFLFSVSTGFCAETCMRAAWKQFGAADFSFEVLEELQKKQTQSDCEFSQDIDTLLELWTEKLKNEQEGAREDGTSA